MCTGVPTFAAPSRSVETPNSNGSGAPSNTFLLRSIERGGSGSGFVDASDEISLAPSMSSLGSFDEQSGSVPQLVLQHAREEDTTDRPLPAVLRLPPAVDHTAGNNRQSLRRRRSSGSIPLALQSAGTVGTRSEEGSTCYFPSTDNVSAGTVEGRAYTERERSSSRFGIAFGGSARRKRSRRLSNSGTSSIGVGSGDSSVAAAVDRDGGEAPASSAAGLPVTGALGAAGTFAPSTVTAVATAPLLKRKINWWRGISKPPPRFPSRSSALTTPTSEDGLSRGTTVTSSAPPCPRPPSDYDDGPARDGSTVPMAPPVSSVTSRQPQHQPATAMENLADDEQTLAGSVASSLTSLGASIRGPVSVRPLADTDSSVASVVSTSAASGSGALATGHSVAGSATTASLATTKGLTAERSGANDVGAGGRTRGTRVNLGEHIKSRKQQRGRGKINLGSKRHQKVR